MKESYKHGRNCIEKEVIWELYDGSCVKMERFVSKFEKSNKMKRVVLGWNELY